MVSNMLSNNSTCSSLISKPLIFTAFLASQCLQTYIQQTYIYDIYIHIQSTFIGIFIDESPTHYIFPLELALLYEAK